MVMKFIKGILYFIVGSLIFLGIYINFSKMNNKNEIPSLSGVSIMKVVNDGMITKAKRGDVVVLKSSELYQTNDIIIYKEGVFTNTSQVVKRDEDKLIIKNQTEEKEIKISSDDVVGKVVLNLSGFGNIWDFLIHPFVTGLLVVGMLGYTIEKLIAQ